ncbi:MAG: hypothetical protein HMLKMBBP_01548 [Planctomycetes bacterium]|nr:hypothetical protein [Planctomycetota bacterium]
MTILASFGQKQDGYSITSDGSNDATAAIQAMEDSLAALGYPVALYFHGTFKTTAPIHKKGNVHWRGSAKIFRGEADTQARPLILAQAQDQWSIDGLTLVCGVFTGDPGGTTGYVSSDITKTNSVIAVGNCADWQVRNCRLFQYTNGIVIFGHGKRFKILNNILDAQRAGYDRAYLLAHPTETWGGGDIVNTFIFGTGANGTYDYDNPANVTEEFEISGNECRSWGVDQGIAVAVNSFYPSPGIVTRNTIQGKGHGIICYQGAAIDPGDSPSWARRVVFSENNIKYCNQSGIYIRSTLGTVVVNNVITFCGFRGYDAGSGPVDCGICYRVGYDEMLTVGGVISDVSGEQGHVCAGNYLENIGALGGSNNSGFIRMNQSGVQVIGNQMVNPAEYGWNHETPGIVCSVQWKDALIVGNRMVNVGTAIALICGNPSVGTPFYDRRWGEIIDNVITDCNAGIEVAPWARRGGRIAGNYIRGKPTIAAGKRGIWIRGAPFTTIESNEIDRLDIGIEFASGCTTSEALNLSSPGDRTGASLRCLNNRITRCGTGITHSETNTNDNDPQLRCQQFHGNYVNGKEQLFGDADGVPNTNQYVRSWHVGDVYRDTSPSAGAAPGSICVTAGKYGSISATCNATNGSRTLTNLSTLAGLGEGVIISVNGQTLVVTTIDVAGNTVEVDSAITADLTGTAITYPTPVFKAMPNLAS